MTTTQPCSIKGCRRKADGSSGENLQLCSQHAAEMVQWAAQQITANKQTAPSTSDAALDITPGEGIAAGAGQYLRTGPENVETTVADDNGATETTEPIIADRCDTCSARGVVRVVKDSMTLTFCGHHARKNVDGLVAGGWKFSARDGWEIGITGQESAEQASGVGTENTSRFLFLSVPESSLAK